MSAPDTSRISPTAHYTGFVWCRHHLSPPELATTAGRAMFHALRAPMALAALATGGITLEGVLLQRHRLIDALLEDAIAEGRVGQVLEVAGGLSGRGWRFSQRHPDLVYVEGDLPGMVARKQRMLAALPGRARHHHVVALDALAADGPSSILEATAPYFEAGRGTAIITEGLLSYFRWDWVRAMWQRFAELLARHPHGVYLSDVHLGDAARERVIATFRALLAAVTRGDVHLHFEDEAALERALLEHGFSNATIHHPSRSGRDYIQVLEARVGP